MRNASARKPSDQIDKSYWQTNGLFIAQKLKKKISKLLRKAVPFFQNKLKTKKFDRLSAQVAGAKFFFVYPQS